jgi:hypothetical protein
MRTIDPSIILAAMATLETPPAFPPPGGVRLVTRKRRVTYAPVTPRAIALSRCA